MARCRKHCWHPATPACEVCCQCGRGHNPPGGARRKLRWADAAHGPHYIGASVRTEYGPGYTIVDYQCHPTGLPFEVVDTPTPEATDEHD